MLPTDAKAFPEATVTLKDGRQGCLRVLRTDDGERLAAMYAGLPLESARFYWPHPLEREQALAVASRAEAPCEVVLVLEMPDGSLGGYAWYRWRDPQAEASTFGICAAGNCQGSGAGRLLMERLMAVAATVGPPVMRLTCQHANTKAVELYLKMGFRVTREGATGKRRHWPAEPQYWMERRCR